MSTMLLALGRSSAPIKLVGPKYTSSCPPVSNNKSISENSVSEIIKSVTCVEYILAVINISPGNLDSSLCFFQSSISHDVLCIEVNKQGDNIQP